MLLLTRTCLGLLLAIAAVRDSSASSPRSPVEVGPVACSSCERELCPGGGGDCSHGIARDPCDCCPGGVCILAEGERCFEPRADSSVSREGPRRYGVCGSHMDCLARTGPDSNVRLEWVCVCSHAGPVCGSDNETRGSACELTAVGASFVHHGPCQKRAVVASGPQARATYEGAAFALDCEARGFPVPSIVWEFRSVDGLAAVLPGDDPAIVVHSRGGPESFTVTSWLQIEALRRNDSGVYVCVASNSLGEDRAATSVQVTSYSP